MKHHDRKKPETGCVDYSDVTPATGTSDNDKPIAGSLANAMPTADFPGDDGSPRTDPDKTIPGAEAATGVDAAETEMTARGKAADK